jgi:hypothetical protein
VDADQEDCDIDLLVAVRAGVDLRRYPKHTTLGQRNSPPGLRRRAYEIDRCRRVS